MNDNLSKISLAIVIPNYNHAAYLVEALESVVQQSLTPAAVHVIDDASTDNSLEIIRPYVERYPYFRLHQQKRNRGVLPNLNNILPELDCSHMLILPADDYLFPVAVANAQALLSKHPAAGICLFDLMDVFPGGKEKRFSYGLPSGPAYFPAQEASRVLRGLGLAGQCFFHVKGLREMGGFPEAMRWHSDHFACWVLALRQGVCYTPEVGGAFRKLPSSYSAQGTISDAQDKVLQAFLDYLNRTEFADIRPGARDGQMLAIFGNRLFSALRGDPAKSYFLSPALRSHLLMRQARGWLRHPVPGPVKRWVRGWFRGGE